jgi:tetratricopeptide (TPR) repeat protein
VNPEAYEAYLKGQYHFPTGTRDGIKRAQNYYEQAIQKDPNFAQAYVGVADCYLSLSELRWLSPQDAYQHANEAVRKAIELDSTLGEAHATLGWLSWRHEWNWRTAEREFRYAVELSPSYVVGHERLALYLSWSGQRAEALAEIAKIKELNPESGSIEASTTYYHLRDYKGLLEVSRDSVTSSPGFWLSHYWLGVAYEGLNEPMEAVPQYKNAIELSEGDQDPTAALAHAYASIGRRAEAEKILGELQQRSKTSYVSPYMIATIYAGLGEKDRAFEFLEKAYRERSSDISYFIKADLRIDNLRSDPRYADLLQRIGLPQPK